MNKNLKIALESIIILVFMFVILIGGLFTYWIVRPNTAQVNSKLDLETWNVETDYNHNAFTDMVYWNGKFYYRCFRI